MTRAQIGIIGAGRLGGFLAQALVASGHRVVAADRKAFRIAGVRRVSVREAASSRVVLLAIPAKNLEALLARIAPDVRPGALVCDLCAVKEAPARWMKALLPPSVDLLGLHPLFGPDSARKSLSGHRIVLTPVRISPRRLLKVKRAIRSHGLLPIVATPREHDRAMARTLFITQFTGRALRGLVGGRGAIRTRNVELLSELITIASNDSPDVLTDLYRYNAFARRVPRAIIDRFRAMSARLAKVR